MFNYNYCTERYNATPHAIDLETSETTIHAKRKLKLIGPSPRNGYNNADKSTTKPNA
jgi:hypothetical protein